MSATVRTTRGGTATLAALAGVRTRLAALAGVRTRRTRLAALAALAASQTILTFVADRLGNLGAALAEAGLAHVAAATSPGLLYHTTMPTDLEAILGQLALTAGQGRAPG